MKATELAYTENELAAIEALKANRGQKLSAKELGVANAVLTSLINKMNKFPGAEGLVIVNKEDCEIVCPACGHKDSHKVYWID